MGARIIAGGSCFRIDMAKPTVRLFIALGAGDGLVLQMETGSHLGEKDRVKRLRTPHFGEEIIHRDGWRSMAGNAIIREGDGVDDMTGDASWAGPTLQVGPVAQAAGAEQVAGIVMADQIDLDLSSVIEVFELLAVPVQQILFAQVGRIV